jgi:uncharacterized membrane protein YvbJ
MQVIQCPNCGFANKAGKATYYCKHCGMPLKINGAKAPVAVKKSLAKPKQHCPAYHPGGADYDGYYDDVLPIDDGENQDRIDPEIIKKIALIALAAVAIIVLVFVLMSA